MYWNSCRQAHPNTAVSSRALYLCADLNTSLARNSLHVCEISYNTVYCLIVSTVTNRVGLILLFWQYHGHELHWPSQRHKHPPKYYQVGYKLVYEYLPCYAVLAEMYLPRTLQHSFGPWRTRDHEVGLSSPSELSLTGEIVAVSSVSNANLPLGMFRMFVLSVSLFVSLFVPHFLACSSVIGLFEVLFSSMKMTLVIQLVCLCPVFESNHVEASHLGAS